MSIIIGLTLITSVPDGEEPMTDYFAPSPQIYALNAWLREAGFDPLKDVASQAGGSKRPQCCTFHCGYVDFPEDEFVLKVISTKWNDPKSVVLVLQREGWTHPGFYR